MAICYSCFKEYGDEFGLCPYCGEEKITEPNEPVQLRPGTVLNNRYIIGRSVGEGGFGVVYKAYDTHFECIVAIKEFFSSRLFTRYPGETSVRVGKKTIEEFKYRKNRFLTEARYIAKYNSNNNIVGVFDHFEENNTAYIVMELLKGTSLSKFIEKSGGKIEPTLAVDIICKICLALKDLHKDNIIHCDIAPDNIFIFDDNTVKVFDFGAAKLADSEDVAIDICMKPGYSPPEQYDQSNNLGPWTDIYAVGATLYLMLTGIKPDESTNRKINDTVIPPHLIDPAISENISLTVMKAMAVEKHLRFRTVDELVNALIGERKVYSLETEKKRRRNRRLIGVASALAAVACVVALVMHTYSDKRSEQVLSPATLTVWYSVEDGSNEKEAMEKVKSDFESKFPDVKIELTAFDSNNYAKAIEKAAENNELPLLFESSGLDREILDKARNAEMILDSPQAKECLFLDMYDNYYSDKKQIPLAIEAPMAVVITSGKTSVGYGKDTFSSVENFGTDRIAIDKDVDDVIDKNLEGEWLSRDTFMNNDANTSAVMLSSTMHINNVRQSLTSYQKKFTYLDGGSVKCNFIYEWSLGKGSSAEEKAAERLLSWMLGDVYQSDLMITVASDGQLPINETCFREKIKGKNYQGIEEVYKHYVFKK